MQFAEWGPFGDLASFRREMDRLFDSFFDRESRFPVGLGDWTPRFDPVESKDSIVIKADLHGMNEKNISVSFTGDNPVIKGERKTDKEPEGLDTQLRFGQDSQMARCSLDESSVTRT